MSTRLFAFALMLCMGSPMASSQIEMNSSGAVGIGSVPTTTAFVTIEAPTGNSTYEALHVIGNASWFNYGIRTEAHGTGFQAFGIHASASAAGPGPEAYAVYGTAPTGDYAGYFDGDVTITGTLTNPSDRQFKEDIEPLDNKEILESLLLLEPSSFLFKTDLVEMNLPSGLQYGLVAQDVQTVFPHLVSSQSHPAAFYDENNSSTESISYESVNYIQLIPILIQAIQEQQREIESLKNLVTATGQ